MLDLKKIKKLRQSALMYERMFHANMLNVEDEAFCDDMAERYWYIAKVNLQVKSLIDRLTAIHENLVDFVAGNFDKYIDVFEYNNEDSRFDPYEELEYGISQEDWTECLPLKISQYSELLKFSQEFSLIETAKSQAFKEFFPDINFAHKVQSSDGETHFIPESDLPDGIRSELEVNREIEEIETDHCLDAYDQWREKLGTMISERQTFLEILSLFK